MIFTESGYIQWMYCYITAGVYLNDFSHLSLKRRYQIHAMKPQTAFEVKPVFGGQKNGVYKPKETGITQPTYPCGAAVREMWVLREVVMDDCEWRQLIWKGCCWHPVSRVLFTEWKNPVATRGLCVVSMLMRLRGNPASRVRAEGVSRGTRAARCEDGFTAWQGTAQLREAVREHLGAKFCICHPCNRRVVLSPPFLDKLTTYTEWVYSV